MCPKYILPPSDRSKINLSLEWLPGNPALSRGAIRTPRVCTLAQTAVQKSRFRCFVLALLRTSREALLHIWGLPIMFGVCQYLL